MWKGSKWERHNFIFGTDGYALGRLDDDRGINNARQNGGRCGQSYYWAVDEELSRNFFFSIIFSSHPSLSLPPFSGETMEAMGTCIVPFHSTLLRTWKSKFASVGTRVTFYSYSPGEIRRQSAGLNPWKCLLKTISLLSRKFSCYFIVQFIIRALAYKVATRILKFERSTTIEKSLEKLPLLIILSIPLQSLYRPCSSTHGPSIVSSTELYPLRTRPQRFPSFGLWVIPLGTEVV